MDYMDIFFTFNDNFANELNNVPKDNSQNDEINFKKLKETLEYLLRVMSLFTIFEVCLLTLKYKCQY